MKFTAVGDVICQRRLPRGYRGFYEIRDFICEGEGRFFNLETTVNREGECFGNQFSGGTYIRCNPEVMRDMLEYGFNMTTFNNNHALDFGHEGLLRTLDNLNETGIVHSGVGRNLSEAASPAYLELSGGRVALISVNTSFNPACMAGEQSKRVKGRPGVNGISVAKRIVLPREDFERVKHIGERTGVNSAKVVARAEGYYSPLPEGVCEIGEQLFLLGEDYGIRYEMNARDLKRVLGTVREARLKADYVLVSVHTHYQAGLDKSEVPSFISELSHALIDEGADAVVGHGPHLLRPVEVYKDRPIFYSLGDFVLQLYDVEIAPADFYAKCGLEQDSCSVIELLRHRSRNFTAGLMEDRQMMETVIPLWETDGQGRLTSLRLLPVELSRGNERTLEGLPQVSDGTAIYERLSKMSRPYGVDMRLEDGVIVCKW